MIKVKINKIREASNVRPAGYFDDVMSYGKVNGEYLELSDDDYALLSAKYSADIPPPKISDLVTNFSTAITKWVSAGFPTLDENEFTDRYKICSSCKFWDESARFNLGKCKHTKCGCTKFKIWMRTEKCPIGKW